MKLCFLDKIVIFFLQLHGLLIRLPLAIALSRVVLVIMFSNVTKWSYKTHFKSLLEGLRTLTPGRGYDE